MLEAGITNKATCHEINKANLVHCYIFSKKRIVRASESGRVSGPGPIAAADGRMREKLTVSDNHRYQSTLLDNAPALKCEGLKG